MSDSETEWTDSVVDVVGEMVQQNGPEATIEKLQKRRETRDDELKARCHEAIAFVRREVQNDE